MAKMNDDDNTPVKKIKANMDDDIRAKQKSQSEKQSEEAKVEKKDKNKNLKRLATAKAAGQAAHMGLQAILMAKIMNILHMGLAMIANLLQAMTGLLGALLGKIGAFFGSIVSAISSFLGIGSIAAGSIVVSAFMVIGAFVVGGITALVDDTAMRGGEVNDCTIKANEILSATGDVDMSKQIEERVKKTYSVMTAIGIPKVNISGLVGNWIAESGFDPTCVETIYTEPYQIGPRKKHAESVDYKIASMNPSYGALYPKIIRVGLGLAQCTDTTDGAKENTEIRTYAKQVGKNWWDFDFQLAFYISVYSKAKWLRSWTKPESSPEAAAYAFAKYFEVNTIMAQDKRKVEAAKWYVRLNEMTVDQSYADSIIAMGESLGAMSISQSASNAVNKCQRAGAGGGNSSLAEAWVSYAYPTKAQGYGNHGTPLFQDLMKNIFPGDPYFMSCDRGVATGVRWSGTDDTYPVGPCSTQEAYLKTSPKWEKISDGNTDKATLKPGDIMIMDATPWTNGRHGHVLGYTGPEIIKKIHGAKATPGADTVSASYMERSPGCVPVESKELQYFRVYRNKEKEANPKYKHLGQGSATNTGAPAASKDK